jgi:hypothetical protein|tara:strand:+ start:1741 stop:2109 length:369 start_codon:yes stop_codon:yes gene_type:complete
MSIEQNTKVKSANAEELKLKQEAEEKRLAEEYEAYMNTTVTFRDLLVGKCLPRAYTLFYRYSTTPPQQKSFWFDGPLAVAIIRGRKHCETMASRFICVRPHFVDLDIQEDDKKSDPSYREPW